MGPIRQVFIYPSTELLPFIIAMLELDNYLFHPVEKMECTYVKENLLEARNNILYPELVKMFKHLLSIETISALRLQALHSNQKGYSDDDFFRDLYKGLFNDFDPSAAVSFSNLLYRLCNSSFKRFVVLLCFAFSCMISNHASRHINWISICS